MSQQPGGRRDRPTSQTSSGAVRVFSSGAAWPGLVLQHYSRQPPDDVEFPPLPHHFLSVYTGRPNRVTQARDGRSHSADMVAGDVAVMPAGQPSRWRWEREADVLHLSLDTQVVARAAEAAGADGGRIELVSGFGAPDPQVRHVALSLLAEMRSAGPAGRLYVESLRDVLAVHLLRHYAVTPAPSPPPAPDRMPAPALRAVLAYIHDDPARGMTLAELAAVAGMTTAHFRGRFQRSVGLAPHQYVIQCRVERAKALLLSGRFSIGEAAAEAGFCDQSHLTRHMRRLLGVTPGTLTPRAAQNVHSEPQNVQDDTLIPGP